MLPPNRPKVSRLRLSPEATMLDSPVLHLHGKKKKGSSIGLLTLLLIACTSSLGSDEPALSCSLARVFVVCTLHI